MKVFYIFFFSFVFTAISQTPTVGTITNTPASLDGYTLFAPLNGYATYLIDNCGSVVNKWTHTAESRLSVELLEDGNLLRSSEGNGVLAGGTSGGSAGRLEKVDWSGNVIWSYEYISTTASNSGQITTHHDFEVLPNGNILVLAWENYDKATMVSQGLDNDFNKDFMWMEKIMEITPTGTSGAIVVWEWNLYDHLIQDISPSKPNFGIVKNNPNKMNVNYKDGGSFSSDWTHANGIDYNEGLDQILVTLKNINEIWVLDHSTTTAEAKTGSGGTQGKGGDILYRWGNPETYDKGLDSDQKITNPHHAEWIPDGYRDEGKIMLYNNGDFWDEITSKVTMIDPNIDANGNYPLPTSSGSYLPIAESWEYIMNLDIVQPNFISDILSGVYRLENGNTLICNGAIQGYFIELDSNDNIVWEYLSPAGSLTDYGDFLSQGDTWATGLDIRTDVFRALRYKPNFIGFTGKDLTPDDPLELNPYPNSCTLYPDSTLVPISIKELDLHITYTNPITNQFILSNPEKESIALFVYSINGQLIHSSTHNNEFININTQHWTSGMFIFKIIDSNRNQKVGKLTKL